MNGAEALGMGAAEIGRNVAIDEAVKAFQKLHILHAKQTINLRKLVENQQKQIDELTKQVNHLRLNLVVRPDKIIKIPEMKK